MSDVTYINIVQDNVVSNVELISLNNPLSFIIRAKSEGVTIIPPDYIYAIVNSVTYKCIYLRDESAAERDFIFIADEIFRSLIGDIADFDQSDNTILQTIGLNKEISVLFTDVDNNDEDTSSLMYVNAARDFESVNGACLVDLYNNESLYYIGAQGQQMYLYWYNDNAANVIGGAEGITIGATTAETAINAMDYFALTYPTNISKIDDTQSLYARTLAEGVFFEAASGESITFSSLTAPSGATANIFNNGTTGAYIVCAFSTQPSNGETLQFTFESDADAGNLITVNGTFGFGGGETFDKGFIRKAITPTTTGEQTHSININGVDYAHDINVRQWCDGDILLKYLDNNGQYRFMPFTKYYSRSSRPQLIGSVNELITSLVTDKSDTRNIGYNNNDTLRLTAHSLNDTELLLMKDLYDSKDVQIYLNKWLRVTIDCDNISKQEKRKFKDITISVKLPKSYNVTEL